MIEWHKLHPVAREIDILVRVSPSGGAVFEMQFPGPEVLRELCQLFWVLGLNDSTNGKSVGYICVLDEITHAHPR